MLTDTIYEGLNYDVLLDESASLKQRKSEVGITEWSITGSVNNFNKHKESQNEC